MAKRAKSYLVIHIPQDIDKTAVYWLIECKYKFVYFYSILILKVFFIFS